MMNSLNEREANGNQPLRKRIITEARKEQNRVAQQLYRKRQRDRIHKRKNRRYDPPRRHLELKPRQLLPVTISDGTLLEAAVQIPSPEVKTVPDIAFQLGHVEFGHPEYNIDELIPTNDSNQDKMSSLPISSTFLRPETNPGIFDNTPNCGSPSLDTLSSLSEVGWLTELHTLSFAEMLQTTPPMLNECQAPQYFNTAVYSCSTPQIEFGDRFWSNTLSPWNSKEDFDSNQQDHSIRTLQDHPFLQKASVEKSPSQTPGLEVLVAAVAKFLLNGCLASNSSCSIPSPPLLNLYRNHIHTSQTATLLGYLHNAHCIGLDLQELVRSGVSPFYQPNACTITDSQSLLAAARKPWIPAHLQPTLPQILIPHHPYLDLIPFPTLRARVIMFAASAPTLFDPMELKRDVFKDGLYCHRQQRGAQPWDMHSWEAAPWFLRKWRLLIG